MKLLRAVFIVGAFACVAAVCGASPVEAGPLFHGMSDASGAVVLGDNQIVVADDETNSLRIYSTTGGVPLSTFDLTAFLMLEKKHPEADIEAATRVGNRVYWLTSHGRSKEGKLMPNRQRFFATDIIAGANGPELRAAGKPCRTLAESIAANPELRKIKLDAALAIHDTDRPDLAPKDGGFNIEGLCASVDGATLYIGLRNPRYKPEGAAQEHAIVIPIMNAKHIIDESQAPEFGPPLLWDLGGLGIRDMAYSQKSACFFIVAGPHAEHAGGALYTWSGLADAKPQMIKGSESFLKGYHPEALICLENSEKMLLLSDDGNRRVPVASAAECSKEGEFQDGTCPNKYIRDVAKRTFRSMWITP